MKLPTKTIGILIALMAIALGGLVALQYVLIENAFEQKEQSFRQNVNAAMNAVVQKLETSEAVGNIFRVAVKQPPPVASHMQMYSYSDDSSLSVSVTSSGMESFARVFVSTDLGMMRERLAERPPLRWEGEKVWYTVNTPQHVLIRMLNQETGKDSIIVNGFKPAGEHSIEIGQKRVARGQYIFKFLSDSTSSVIQVQNGRMHPALPDKMSFGRREQLVGQVVDKMFYSEQIPIERRLNGAVLDTVIASSLKAFGIDLPFACGVISERNDSLQLIHAASYANELRTSGFKARLFPNDVFLSFNQLALYFPDQQIFILKQVGPLLALTVLFLGIIVYCFAYTVRTIIRQKEFSVRLIDFINNMTHEFKTPISTVSVAAETMMHPNVIRDEEKLKRYGTVIQDENLRMKHQVDKILQMAVLEEGTYKLKCMPVDLHEIISKAAEGAAMQVENRGGTVTVRLEAESPVMNADVVHITNVINNILDNSIKYSNDIPEISVHTENVNGSIRITFTDNGIGIPAEDQQHVFEKYFRVHTGNIHNVKGFGLGLSYVKLMTEAHGGSIRLESEPGKGTTITLTFPVLK
ncbi:MAG TPA: HAMP domain-containing sensor histidine kinase [Bacteroidota bacterium]|nr:HAMP domain-containing sensor histidine kinase [Bacteroidota bacterium]